MICNNDKGQTYVLYLPSSYNSDKVYPCIYFFDAHARGSLPVRMYKELAEKYGFVIVGSNVSKNGIQWDATNNISKTLMQDISTRVHVDSKRIYTAGFSGGSRVASSIALFNGGIAGVIGCSAGFPNVQQLQQKFDYFGLVGTKDFNYDEMQHLDANLQAAGFNHQLTTFDGIHGWPPVADMETAILWMQVNAMKEGLLSKNADLINTLKNDYDKRITSTERSNDWVTKHQLLDGAIRVLNGVIDITRYQKQLTELMNTPANKEAVTQQQQLEQKGISLQQELGSSFGSTNETLINNEINKLRKSVQTARTKQESQVYQRVLSYAGFLCYMYSDKALKNSDIAYADMYLKAFKLADPNNPDVGFLRAIYYIKKGDKAATLDALSNATSLGYNDVATLLSEANFNDLHSDPEFQKIIMKATDNLKLRK